MHTKESLMKDIRSRGVHGAFALAGWFCKGKERGFGYERMDVTDNCTAFSRKGISGNRSR